MNTATFPTFFKHDRSFSKSSPLSWLSSFPVIPIFVLAVCVLLLFLFHPLPFLVFWLLVRDTVAWKRKSVWRARGAHAWNVFVIDGRFNRVVVVVEWLIILKE